VMILMKIVKVVIEIVINILLGYYVIRIV